MCIHDIHLFRLGSPQWITCLPLTLSLTFSSVTLTLCMSFTLGHFPHFLLPGSSIFNIFSNLLTISPHLCSSHYIHNTSALPLWAFPLIQSILITLSETLSICHLQASLLFIFQSYHFQTKPTHPPSPPLLACPPFHLSPSHSHTCILVLLLLQFLVSPERTSTSLGSIPHPLNSYCRSQCRLQTS